jgi:hypothetical protein
MKNILGFGEAKQTVNIPIVIEMTVNKANVKIPIVDGCMREQNIFLSMINVN